MTDQPTTQEGVEELAALLHRVYQVEAERQGDVRHADLYADLPENVKEYDRVLARFILNRESLRKPKPTTQERTPCTCHGSWPLHADAQAAALRKQGLELDSLRRERDEFHAERDALKDAWDRMHDLYTRDREEIEQARAEAEAATLLEAQRREEIDRLKAVLREKGVAT